MSAGLPVEEIRLLFNKASEHHVYVGEGGDTRKLEAFLMLAVVFEGMLVSFGLTVLGKSNLKKLLEKRQNYYGMDNAVTDLYMLKAISDDEFQQLQDFKKDRNRCIHPKLVGAKNLEEQVSRFFAKHQDIFVEMLNKFEEIQQ